MFDGVPHSRCILRSKHLERSRKFLTTLVFAGGFCGGDDDRPVVGESYARFQPGAANQARTSTSSRGNGVPAPKSSSKPFTDSKASRRMAKFAPCISPVATNESGSISILSSLLDCNRVVCRIKKKDVSADEPYVAFRKANQNVVQVTSGL